MRGRNPELLYSDGSEGRNAAPKGNSARPAGNTGLFKGRPSRVTLRTSVALACGLIAVSAQAVNPLGSWTGKMLVKMPTFPPNFPAEQRTKISGMLAQMKAGEFMLTVLKGGKYTMKAVGMPAFPQSVTTGTWKVAGDTVILKGSESTSLPLSFKVAKDGKTMACKLPADKGSMVFTR